MPEQTRILPQAQAQAQAPHAAVLQGPVLSEAEIAACAKASLDAAGHVHQWLFARAVEAAVLAKFGEPVAYRTLVGDYGTFQKYNYAETEGAQALYALDEQSERRA